MPITDENGNKLPQAKMDKKEKSRQERGQAKQRARMCIDNDIRTTICPNCGFHVRGAAHKEGLQHKTNCK